MKVATIEIIRHGSYGVRIAADDYTSKYPFVTITEAISHAVAKGATHYNVEGSDVEIPKYMKYPRRRG